jgi:hypothetical protein
MAGIPYSEIFLNFYTRYLGDTQVIDGVYTVDTTDPEWQIGIQHYNTAVRRWGNIDGVLWDELWTQLSSASDGTKTYTSGTYSYACPTNMNFPGGTVTLSSTTNPLFMIPVVDSQDVQALSNNAPYAYFTGNQHTGYFLNLNTGSGDSQFNGYTINYPYYAKPTYLAVTETGTTVCQMRDPEFAINTMLSLRYQESRNFPAQQIADRDATQSLANMEVRNAMGSPGPGNGWYVTAFGPGFGSTPSGGFFS